MQYDPIKDRLGYLFSKNPVLQRIFYTLLDLFFLRAWYVRREIHQIIRSMPSDRVIEVLDAGTGFGQYAYHVASQYPNTHILAVDVKRDYLENARRFLDQTPEGKRVDVAYEDLTQLEAEGPFDLILSVDVMEHIEDDRAVFRNFEKVLRPGGKVLINTPSDLGGSDVKEEGDTSFIEEHVRDGYNLGELKSKLLEAGLQPVRTLYTYGPYGSLAWRMLIKYPIQMIDKSRVTALLLPLYYLFAFPAGMLLNAIDVRQHNEKGTGLLVIAEKPLTSTGP